MNLTGKIALLFIAGAIAFAACKKKDDSTNTTPTPTKITSGISANNTLIKDANQYFKKTPKLAINNLQLSLVNAIGERIYLDFKL